MNADFQTVAALAIVVVTTALLARSLLKKRKSPGCGGGCACPSTQLKAKLKR
jgi:hypothetical protein